MKNSPHYVEFQIHDPKVIFNFIAEYPFATIALNDPAGGVPAIAQAPVLIDGNALEFHLARANPAIQAFLGGKEALLIFNGPNGYVSPGWYCERFRDGGDRSQTAPTWDYTTVHARGHLNPIADDQLPAHLERLVTDYESRGDGGWSFSEIKPDFLQRLIPHIQGFRCSNLLLRAIFKLSQEQQTADIPHIAAGLERRNHGFDLLLADAIRKGGP